MNFKYTMIALAMLSVLHDTYAEENPTTLQNVNVENLSGLFGFRRECLGGQYFSDIISETKISRIVVLANTTSALDNVHLARLSNLINENPQLSSLWVIDENTGEKTRDTQYDYLIPFFQVLLEDRDGKLVGILFARNVVKVVTINGLGIIETANKPMQPTGDTRAGDIGEGEP